MKEITYTDHRSGRESMQDRQVSLVKEAAAVSKQGNHRKGWKRGGCQDES